VEFSFAKNPGFAGLSPGSTRLSTGVDRRSRKGDWGLEKHLICSLFPGARSPQQGCGELTGETWSILAARGLEAAVFVFRSDL
jgi:hypothetical protein